MSRASEPAAARLAAITILRRLRDAGHIAYLAGGCVRDALLGLDPTDFDIATDAVPPRVQAIFKHSQAVGAAFGVILVHMRGNEFGGHPDDRVSVEVATFRADGPYSDARRPDAVRFSDPVADAQRRDFTINALFLDPLCEDPDGPKDNVGRSLGTLIDHVGGKADLDARLLRAVGDPERRLAEDHLRALRAARFAARFRLAIDPTTAQAIRRHAAGLGGVSRERIGEELRRMLVHPSRCEALEHLQTLGLDAPVLDQAHQSPPLRLVRALGEGPLQATPGDIALVLAAWWLDRGGTTRSQDVAHLRRALMLSNDESEALRSILALSALVRDDWRGMSIASKKRAAAGAMFSRALRLATANNLDEGRKVAHEAETLAMDGIGLGPEPFICGDDLVASGYTPGPGFRRVLDSVYDAQLEGRVRDKAAAMELAGRLSV